MRKVIMPAKQWADLGLVILLLMGGLVLLGTFVVGPLMQLLPK